MDGGLTLRSDGGTIVRLDLPAFSRENARRSGSVVESSASRE
jgi:hypothetical protein